VAALGEPVLADKSAWVQQAYSETARDRIEFLRATSRLHLCAVTIAELLYSSRSAEEMAADEDDLSLLGVLHIDTEVEDRVTWIMRKFAARGQHRAPSIADLFVSAVAMTHEATLLHYDKDFELIADVTGMRQEWILPRGTGHGHG
jgi:predicted nucleic acid-binding protein